jgi:hypothetical protein
MKRIIILTILLAAILTGCTKPYWERLDSLDAQITELEEQLKQQNETIAGLYTVLLAYNSRDFITGITQLPDNGGYAIHFDHLGDIVIYHGTDAHVPRVGIKRNPTDGNYYWTIQYGNNEAEFIVNDTGNMISAVGMVPLLKIENGKFYISYDSRQTWQYLGDADGVNGDSIFEKITVTDDYVTFVTTEEEFKIPTNKLVQTLYQNATTANQNLSTFSKLINDLVGSAVYVTSVKNITSDGKVVGTEISLSNGSTITINDWIGTQCPAISAEKGDGDEVYYWAKVFSDGSIEWIRDSFGNRVAATGKDVEIPIVVPVLDPADNIYYWNVVAAGDTTLLLGIDGKKVPAASYSGAPSIFTAVDTSNPEYILLTLAHGAEIKLPKVYSISLGATNLKMPAGATKSVPFRVYGADEGMTYSVLTQGDISATVYVSTAELGTGNISVTTGSDFSGSGKVIFVVSAGNGSVKTMVKGFSVTREE